MRLANLEAKPCGRMDPNARLTVFWGVKSQSLLVKTPEIAGFDWTLVGGPPSFGEPKKM